MNYKLGVFLAAVLIVVPASVGAFVSCRDTDKGCTLEQLVQLNKDAITLGFANEERVVILQEMVAKLVALIAQLQPASSSTAGASCLDLTQDLYIGKTDAGTKGEVSKLQKFLLDNGYGDPDGDSGFLLQRATGYYGNQTAQAVVKWQKAHGMDFVTTKSGVGPMTRGKMKCITETKLPITKIVWRIEQANPGTTDSYKKDEQVIFIDVIRSDNSIRGYNLGKAYGCKATSENTTWTRTRTLGVNCYYALAGVTFTAYEDAGGKFFVERHDDDASGRTAGKITIVLELWANSTADDRTI